MIWTTLHATIHQTLRQRKLLAKGQEIALAFSAGQDSMCLLQILRDLQPKWGWRVRSQHYIFTHSERQVQVGCALFGRDRQIFVTSSFGDRLLKALVEL